MPIQIKKDPYLWLFAGLLVLATMGAVMTGHATFKEATAFIIGALAMPALLGGKDKTPPAPPSSGGGDPYRTSATLPPAEIPPPSPPERTMLFLPFRALPLRVGAHAPFVFVVATQLLAFACGAVDPQIEAPAGYDAQQKACIDRYNTREAIDACRNRVKAEWSNDAGADAGGDR